MGLIDADSTRVERYDRNAAGTYSTVLSPRGSHSIRHSGASRSGLPSLSSFVTDLKSNDNEHLLVIHSLGVEIGQVS
jgi:hypothetical protein